MSWDILLNIYTVFAIGLYFIILITQREALFQIVQGLFSLLTVTIFTLMATTSKNDGQLELSISSTISFAWERPPNTLLYAGVAINLFMMYWLLTKRPVAHKYIYPAIYVGMITLFCKTLVTYLLIHTILVSIIYIAKRDDSRRLTLCYTMLSLINILVIMLPKVLLNDQVSSIVFSIAGACHVFFSSIMFTERNQNKKLDVLILDLICSMVSVLVGLRLMMQVMKHEYEFVGALLALFLLKHLFSKTKNELPEGLRRLYDFELICFCLNLLLIKHSPFFATYFIVSSTVIFFLYTIPSNKAEGTKKIAGVVMIVFVVTLPVKMALMLAINHSPTMILFLALLLLQALRLQSLLAKVIVDDKGVVKA